MRLAEVRRLVDQYLRLRSQLVAPPSPTGMQLEALKNGMIGKRDDSGDWRAATLADRRFSGFGALVYLFEVMLNEEERAVLIGMQTPLGHTRACGYRLGVVRCQCGAIEYFERSVPESSLELVQLEDEPPTRETSRGEAFLRYRDDLDGWVVVEGTVPAYPTYEQIGERMGLTVRQVRSRIQSANRKISEGAEGRSWGQTA